jgi:hypothetical protein
MGSVAARIAPVNSAPNQGAFIPASCPDYLADNGFGHLTNYQVWQLDQDPQMRRGYMSYNQDSTIADFFLGIGGPAFEAALFPEMAQAEDAHPDRVRSWIATGNGHTFLLTEAVSSPTAQVVTWPLTTYT